MHKIPVMRKSKVFIILVIVLCALSSCTRKAYPDGYADSKRDRREKAEAYSQILGVKVTTKDNLRFYGEVVSWMRTPYRYGGNNRSGVDCSGFVRAVYRDVYNISLNRSVQGIYDRDINLISKKNARTGDLVFFRSPNSRTLSHVGIYLKDGYFVHASTSRGVVVDNLEQAYYKKNWQKTGRIK